MFFGVLTFDLPFKFNMFWFAFLPKWSGFLKRVLIYEMVVCCPQYSLGRKWNIGLLLRRKEPHLHSNESIALSKSRIADHDLRWWGRGDNCTLYDLFNFAVNHQIGIYDSHFTKRATLLLYYFLWGTSDARGWSLSPQMSGWAGPWYKYK